MPNRLRTSTSPYLRQHADNPVDWHEWGDEAFREAAERDVPVLLSVGYSACHWCHVMAHESFEDPDVAAVMNERFVNIKVDREERPDVDAVYMTAVQALTGHGGWPMTVWLDPERRPFYAGTYFPPTPRAGMASFPQVMDAITDAWHSRRNDLTHQAEQLTDAVSRQIPPGAEVPGSEDLQNAYAHFAEHHDPVHGGIGGAPKFPQQPSIDFLLRITGRPWAPKAGAMARQSLEKIAAGGIHDQVGGGFARYSVDSEWLVPHFEKMLYDNAQLARLYLRAGQVFGSTWFTTVAIRTFEYMDRDLGHPDGGFQSAEDADSDGREGAFYVWKDEDFRAATGDLADFGASRYGVTPSGNFEGENVLHISRLLSELASERDITVEEAAALDDEVRRRLMTAREGRTRPGLDDKIVTAWNGLAIGAFAEGGAVLARDDLIDRAVRAAEFVLDRMVDDGRLQRTWAQGTARIPAFLDDHAAMALACFTLYEATSEVRWFRQAEALTRRIPELFAAPDGGFFTVGRDAEQLLVRQKDLMDNPAPSGNSLATEALLRLAAYTGDGSLVELAEQAMAAAALIVERSPSAVGHLLGAIDFDASGAVEVAIVGPEADRFTEVVWSEHRPNMVVATDRTGTDDAHVPLLESRWKDGQTLAYVCEDFECRAPTSEPAELAAQLPAVTASARS